MTLQALKDRVLAHARQRPGGLDPFEIGLPGLSISVHRQPTDLFAVRYWPIFCLVLQGAKQTSIGEQIVTFAAGRSVIIGVELPTFARVLRASTNEPYVALSIHLDLSLLKELGAELEGSTRGESPLPAIASGEADEAVIDAMSRLLGLVDKPAAISVLQPLIVREIHFWLLSAGHGAILRQIAHANTPTARIAEAAARIRRTFAEPLHIPQLARETGMSESTFHLHFRTVCGTTPLQFQKRLRLLEARRLILAEDHSVSAAALSVGYESPTQFSREFSRLFGLPPKRARQAAGKEIQEVAV